MESPGRSLTRLIDSRDTSFLYDVRFWERRLGRLSESPLPQANAFQRVRGRAGATEIATPIGNHSCRMTGITAHPKNGGTLERAATMANRASTRTTQLYDRLNRAGSTRGVGL